MARLFVGVPCPPGPDLGRAAEAVSELDGARPVDPSLYHVTLAFIGDAPDDRIDGVAEVVDAGVGVAGVAAHEGRLVGLGAFPAASKARVAWAGIEGTELDALAASVRTALAAAGIDHDARPFHAHLTLARFRATQDLSALVGRWDGRDLGRLPVKEVVLFRSTLGSSGPVYEIVSSSPLEASE